jgi:hypothetical protein
VPAPVSASHPKAFERSQESYPHLASFGVAARWGSRQLEGMGSELDHSWNRYSPT